VDQLGGELAVRTAPGAGTTFTLRVPLTLTIVDAFSFRCGAHGFVTPVSGVEEVMEIDPARIVRAPAPLGAWGARGVITLIERRGEPVPLVDLGALFELDAVRAGRALLVRRNGLPFAFGVSRVLGQQEVVVRPLEDPLVKVPGISGSTDLGDGRPTLVLDLIALSGTFSAGRREVAS
jgi:two-component system chemotaxis sensor kinase CheA